jgi:hypothetical protein
MKAQTIIIDKKRFAIIPEKEYLGLLEDINDIKKVFKRKNEPGIEAALFFTRLKNKKKPK